MSAANKTERDPEKRCKSAHVEREGRTHYCRSTADHFSKHTCLCSLTWEDYEAKKVTP